MTSRQPPATGPVRTAPEPGTEGLRGWIGQAVFGREPPWSAPEPAYSTDNPPPEVRAARQQQAARAAGSEESDMTDEQFTPEETAEFEDAVAAQQARQQGDEAAAGVPLTAVEQVAFDAFELTDAQVEAFNEMSAEDQQSALDEMVSRYEAAELRAAEPRDGTTPEDALARGRMDQAKYDDWIAKVKASGRYLGQG